MTYTMEMLSELRERIRPYLTTKRYAHTLAVEKMAGQLGGIYLPEQTDKLMAAALLHDITKMADIEKQLQYCKEFAIIMQETDLFSPKTFHAKTAVGLIKKEFDTFADPEVLSAVRWHTTGHADMTEFEAIVYLADYIEETRTFPDCVKLRTYFWEQIGMAETELEKRTILWKTMVLSFDMTIQSLMEEGAPIDKDTIAARNSYIYSLKQSKADCLPSHENG